MGNPSSKQPCYFDVNAVIIYIIDSTMYLFFEAKLHFTFVFNLIDKLNAKTDIAEVFHRGFRHVPPSLQIARRRSGVRTVSGAGRSMLPTAIESNEAAANAVASTPTPTLRCRREVYAVEIIVSGRPAPARLREAIRARNGLFYLPGATPMLHNGFLYRYDEFDHAFVNARVEEFRDQVARRLKGDITEGLLMNGCLSPTACFICASPCLTGRCPSSCAAADRPPLGRYGHFTTRQNLQFN